MEFNTNIPVVEIIGKIVDIVEDKVIAQLSAFDSNIEKVNYQYGHPQEIMSTLIQYDQDPSKRKEKFPLVMLVQDFQEKYFGKSSLPYPVVNLRIIIAYHTLQDYKAKDRYEKTFKPVLYPIYNAFINSLVETLYFTERFPYDIQHVKTDRLFWGKDDLSSIGGNVGNYGNSYLDAIEISNLQLTVNLPFCQFLLNP